VQSERIVRKMVSLHQLPPSRTRKGSHPWLRLRLSETEKNTFSFA